MIIPVFVYALVVFPTGV